MVGEGVGKILKKEGKFLLRIPKNVAEDSNFPFAVSEDVKVCFEVGDSKLVVKKIDP